METKESVQLHECCVVPYRRTQFGVEFCLVTPISENRWEFPKISLDADGAPSAELLEKASARVGLKGQLQTGEPLGHFEAKRGNEARSMTGYLMHVVEFTETWPQQKTHKRLWCLAEEGRVRIRRKPLRQFIDLALHCVAAKPQPSVNGNGHGNGHASAARHA